MKAVLVRVVAGSTGIVEPNERRRMDVVLIAKRAVVGA
jgi:hypothetical protein